jgi:hypothetical protein
VVRSTSVRFCSDDEIPGQPHSLERYGQVGAGGIRPFDWLQLDRALGVHSVRVDQRNGDKVVHFRVTLPRTPNSNDGDVAAPFTPETAPNMFFK